MVNFIVCDDNITQRKLVVDVISKVMMRNQLAYKNYIFTDYNDSFLKIIESPLSCKIYILDIETPSRSGIDIARLIRQKDCQSILIFLTVHDECCLKVTHQVYMPLSFICKFDDQEKKLEQTLIRALNILDQKQVVRISEKDVIYTIPQEDILYVIKDVSKRRCIIKTVYSEFSINKTLSSMQYILNQHFIKSHRSCIVNRLRIRMIDIKKREIVFDNGETINLLSNSFKKEFKQLTN